MTLRGTCTKGHGITSVSSSSIARPFIVSLASKTPMESEGYAIFDSRGKDLLIAEEGVNFALLLGVNVVVAILDTLDGWRQKSFQ
jgi:hypothetical protein